MELCRPSAPLLLLLLLLVLVLLIFLLLFSLSTSILILVGATVVCLAFVAFFGTVRGEDSEYPPSSI
jgi:hypothetical protein